MRFIGLFVLLFLVGCQPAPTPTVRGGPTKNPDTFPEKQVLNVRITGYGYPDNSPPGREIAHSVIHKEAGGVGTFDDPVTVAVRRGDYAYGTKFYFPFLKRYGIVEDACGACHDGMIDIWVGGTPQTRAVTLACESKITGDHVVVKDPIATYEVSSGAISDSGCETYDDPDQVDK